MTAYIYKPKRRRNGRRLESKHWHLRYRLAGESRLRDKSLEVSDRQVAEKMKLDFCREIEREREGMIPAKQIRDASQRPLVAHLEDYLGDLSARGRDERYIGIVERRIKNLLQQCGWKVVADVTSDSFLGWRMKQDMAAKTLNDYLDAASSLLTWMVRHGRIPANALKAVGKVEARGMETRVRRALAEEEAKKLLSAAPVERRAMYRTALLTGLRHAELEQLLWGDIQLGSGHDGAWPSKFEHCQRGITMK